MMILKNVEIDFEETVRRIGSELTSKVKELSLAIFKKVLSWPLKKASYIWPLITLKRETQQRLTLDASIKVSFSILPTGYLAGGSAEH